MHSIAEIRTDLMASDKETGRRILRGLSEMLSEDRLKHSIGVAETARRLLPKRTPSDGLTELWRKNRLDLRV